MKKYAWLAAFALSLGGCDEAADVSYPDISLNQLSYTYPYNGQTQVSPESPFVARFSDPIKAFDASAMTQPEIDAVLNDLRSAIAGEATWVRASDDAVVTFSVELVDNDPSADGYNIDTLLLIPDTSLQLVTSYEVDLSGLSTDKGAASINVSSVDFVTRGDAKGARTTAITDPGFSVEKIIPDGSEFPLADFSSLRLQFSHPLDASTVVYGSSISLLDDADALVPATVLVSGVKLTIDPLQDLTADSEYQLVIADNALFDRFGVALAGESWSLTPVDTTPRSLLAQQSGASNPDPLLQCDKTAIGEILSPLTGDAINCVPIKSVLLGDTTSSQTTGDLFAELAFVPNFPDTTPLRISRGTLLSGASVDVLVAGYVPMLVDTDDDGEVDTPLTTGDIAVTFLSDANGYLFANPYTNKPDQPRHVRLLLDVAMTAETAEANGGLSQDLLHVEVVGTSIVIDGKMVIEAIGVVEPRVLGLDDAFGLLSFHMETYVDNDDAPPPLVDVTLPTLQSWVPGDRPDAVRPGDPVLINFSEPVDPASLAQAGAISFKRNGVDVPFDWRLDGATVVIQPQSPLQLSGDGGDVTYTLGATGLVTDLAGNPLDQDYSYDFALPVYEGVGTRAAMATGTYPGFPCAIAGGTMNLALNDHGRCLGGKAGDEDMPVTVMPENRPIQVQFSQNMDASTFVVGASCNTGTFRVEVVNDVGVCQSVVAGELNMTARSLEFVPDVPWQSGQLYRYVLASESGFTGADCGVSAVCTEFDYPLQTALLQGNDPNDGGPNMVIYFRGGAPVAGVYQALANLPTFDVNADFDHSDSEDQPTADPDNAGSYLTPPNATELALTGTGGLLEVANVGCGFNGRDAGDTWIGANPTSLVCNDKKYVYLNGALSADVLGWNESEGAIEVHVYPSIVMTTSADTYAVLNLIIFKELDLIPTGPQVMRIRYRDNGSGVRNQPAIGYIRETVDGPVLEITLDVYLDAPQLEPEALGLTLTHSLHSYPLTLNLAGPVVLLPDGRMNIGQTNITASDPINVDIALLGFGAASMALEIPQGGINLNYISSPLKQ